MEPPGRRHLSCARAARVRSPSMMRVNPSLVQTNTNHMHEELGRWHQRSVRAGREAGSSNVTSRDDSRPVTPVATAHPQHRLHCPGSAQRLRAARTRGPGRTDRHRHRREVGAAGGRRNPGLRKASATHRLGTAARTRPVHGEPVRPAAVLPIRRRPPRRARLRGVAGTLRARHDNELGARRRTRGLPADVSLAGAAGHGTAGGGTRRHRPRRRLLGRPTAGTPPDRGHPGCFGEHRAVPGVPPAEPARMAQRPDRGGRRGCRPQPASWWSESWPSARGS